MITVPWWFTIINDATDDFRQGAYKDYGIECNVLKIQREANKYRFKNVTITIADKEVPATKIMSEDEIPEELRLKPGEIETWHRYERMHIAKALFKEAGYEIARHWAEMNNVSLEDVRPCEGADNQCHMDCPLLGRCADVIKVHFENTPYSEIKKRLSESFVQANTNYQFPKNFFPKHTPGVLNVY